MTANKVGFPCKWIDRPDQVDGIKPKDECRKYNTGATTVAWLNRQHRDTAVEKLWDLVKGNIESTRMLVERVGGLPDRLRMVRLSSDILPMYTEPSWRFFYALPEVRAYCARAFARVGEIARQQNVRLSFHPGQFTCIVSEKEDIVQRSIEELEYHADMARWMGYGQRFQDFKINVHLSGRLGVDGFEKAWTVMTDELKNCLTLENDEYQQNINSLLVLADKVPIVLDIHHHFISDEEYIMPSDDRIKMIIDSWRGVTPVIHYSQSREEYIAEYSNCMPYMKTLLLKVSKSALRSHSDFYNNKHINQWALSHLEWSDIMTESKSKNLGASQLFSQLQGSI